MPANDSTTCVHETEQELVSRAQTAVSQCNWTIGQCAAKWTVKYAQGRTDADFAALIGLSPDQVYQRRRVWETFGAVYQQYASLKWSHFYVALSWDDAADCLEWAHENEATVAEMKAWRRAQRGEDLTAEPEADDFSGDSAVAFVPTEPTPVRDPGQRGGEVPMRSPESGETAGSGNETAETVAGVAREAEGEKGYAPYRHAAGSPAPSESPAETAVAEKPPPDAGQLLRRATRTVERLNRALTPELVNEIRKLPEKHRDRLIKAVAELSAKTAQLT